MTDRPVRLGDVIDDYCPRCRLLLNHDVASLVGTRGGQGHLPHLLQHPRLSARATCPKRKPKKDDKKKLMEEVLQGMPLPPRPPPRFRTSAADRSRCPPRRLRAPLPLRKKRDLWADLERIKKKDSPCARSTSSSGSATAEELSSEEIGFFIRGYAEGQIPDYQAAAFAMAVFFRGMTPAETLALTEVMMRTGEVLDLSELPGPKVDKHSTGGVGDKTSLVLAPLAAACGVYVPMISGRGLGHTGGTLDKLESIPGFRVNLSLAEFRTVLKHAKLGLIGQTPQIAPADRKLYALRDVTATVESLPLISASIMSKKMAEGIDALVLDVKTGDGAFMKTLRRLEGPGADHGHDRPGHGQEGGRPHHRHGPAPRPHRGQRPRGASSASRP